MKFRTQYNFDKTKGKEKVSSLPSLTVPNQTLSLRTLLERYTRGQEIPTKQPVYYGEASPIMHDIQKMDFSERLDLAKSIKETISEQQKLVKTLETSEAIPGKVGGEEERLDNPPS